MLSYRVTTRVVLVDRDVKRIVSRASGRIIKPRARKERAVILRNEWKPHVFLLCGVAVTPRTRGLVSGFLASHELFIP
ncbi:hypothetical protein LCGC14_2298000, partial [marine sediment metagenome]